MKRIGVVHPTSLVAKEIRERLEQRTELWTELRLLSTREEEIGTVTEVAGRATLVEPFDADEATAMDLLVLCDDREHTTPVLALLAPTVTTLVLAREATAAAGQVLVDGVNLDGVELGQVLISPHPVVLALSRLLLPVRSLGLTSCSATILQPASFHGEAALDEVFSQTRKLLGFHPIGPGGPFGAQIAFNLLPADNEAVPDLSNQLQELIGIGPRISLQILQAGVFHGLSISACCQFEGDPGAEALRDAFEAAPGVELVDDPDELGPVLAASRDEVLVGHVRLAEEWPGACWLWGVADHLVLEGSNAVAICAARLAGR